MGLQFIFGGSGYGKSKQVYADILKQAKENPHTNFYVVVSEQFTMETQKELCSMSAVGGFMNIDVLSFNRLSYLVLEEVGKNTIPVLDETGKSLILQRISKTEQNELPTIGGNITKMGYIHEVKSLISEFMQYDLSPEDISKLIGVIQNNQALQWKLKDLQKIYAQFLAYINETYITNEEKLGIVTEALKESKIIRDSVIVFDGFTEFTPVQNKFIQELFKYTKDVWVTVLLDEKKNPYEEFTEQDLFYLSMKMVNQLKVSAKLSKVEQNPDWWVKGVTSETISYPHGYRYLNKPEFAFLEKNLFRYQKEVYEQPTKAMQLVEAMSPADEVRFVCEQICKLAQKEGIRYKDITVVTGNLKGYAHLLEKDFERFKIPYFLDLPKEINKNPFIEYMKSALEIITKGYTYENIFHFLRSGMISVKRESIDKLENYVVALGIKGVQTWEKPFYRISRDFNKNYEQELKEINEVRKVFVALLEPFHMQTKTVEEKIHLFYQFIVDSKLEEKIWQRSNWFEKNGEQIQANDYRQIYRLVMDLLNQFMELLADEEMSWDDFSEMLFAGFDEIRIANIPQNRDSVVIEEIKRVGLKETKILFFVGVNDGIIPQVEERGGILSDIDRDFIEKASFELSPTPRKKMFDHRMYLYMNMTKSTERLYISYAKVDVEGKALRPSYFVHIIQNLYPQILNIRTKQLNGTDRLYANLEGMDYFVARLREYSMGGNQDENSFEKSLPELTSLYRYFSKTEDVKKLNHLIESAFYKHEDTRIRKELAQALYGKILENSVSRLEKYAGCAYAHFLQYGLHLSEREEYRFEAKDTGTILHGVLEEFSNQLEGSEYTWFDFPEDVGEFMVEDVLDRFSKTYAENILFDSNRNTYEITRMKRILTRSIFTLQHQIQEGLFTPTEFEVSFSMYQDLDSLHIALSEEEEMHLRGRIDRVDVCEESDKVYVKVIDYKSGNNKFDLVALYYGLQLQLVLYMNVATEQEKMKHPKKEIIPTGLFYYHVKDPVIATKGEVLSIEAIEESIRKEQRMEGVANSREDCIQKIDASLKTESEVFRLKYKKDGSLTAASAVMEEEAMQSMSTFVNQKIKNMGQKILGGDIAVNPYTMGTMSACTYCKFQSICKIHSRLPGYFERELDKLSTDEVIELMKKEVEGEQE